MQKDYDEFCPCVLFVPGDRSKLVHIVITQHWNVTAKVHMNTIAHTYGQMYTIANENFNTTSILLIVTLLRFPFIVFLSNFINKWVGQIEKDEIYCIINPS